MHEFTSFRRQLKYIVTSDLNFQNSKSFSFSDDISAFMVKVRLAANMAENIDLNMACRYHVL